MGIAEESRQAVSRHRSAVGDLVAAVHDLAATVDTCRRRLAADGPIGTSADPDLERARSGLEVARQRLVDAATAAQESREPGRRYVERVFPP